MRLIEKINKFEDGTETVENFNKIFSNCPILGFSSTDIVTIGECCSPETTRMLTVNEERFRHNFIPAESDIVVEVVSEETTL